MLENIFLQILNMSFTGGIVIAVVLLARLLLKRAPKIFSYVLWSVVLFRLICPFSLESVFSLLPTKTSPITQDIVYMQTPTIDTDVAAINDSVNAYLPAATPYTSINPLQLWLLIGGVVWVLGIAILLIYSLVTLLQLKRRLKTAMFYKENVFLSDEIDTAFVLGALRPNIYLPANLNDRQREYILLHEQTHIKRFDHLVKLLSFFVLCLHWFNPLAWIAFFASGKDMEMSCDEAVVRMLGNTIKKDYSTSLLTLATGRRMVGGTPLAFGEGDTRGRIKNVLGYKKPAFWVVLVAVVSCVVVIICFSVNPIRLPFNFSMNAVVSAWSMDKRGSEDPAAVELTEEQIHELMSRIENISAVKPSDEYGGFTPLYSISALLADNTHFYINGYASDSDRINIVYQDKAYKITDARFADYFSHICEAKELWALRPMVMINGALYLGTGKEGPMGSSDAVIGTIKTTVDPNKKPAEHEQSNFGFVGSEYAVGEDFIQVNIDGKWIVFEAETQSPSVQYSIARLSKDAPAFNGVSTTVDQLGEAVIMDVLVKSAAWEGVDITTLEECYRIRQTFSETGEVHDYYAYRLKGSTAVLSPGTAVLQSGADGWYSALSDDLYELLAKDVIYPDTNNDVPVEKDTNYRQSLTTEELAQTEEVARNYFTTEAPYYEGVESIEIMPDSSDLYQNTGLESKYEAGNIIIYKVLTGRDKKDHNPERHISVARTKKDAAWEVINHGY